MRSWKQGYRDEMLKKRNNLKKVRDRKLMKGLSYTHTHSHLSQGPSFESNCDHCVDIVSRINDARQYKDSWNVLMQCAVKENASKYIYIYIYFMFLAAVVQQCLQRFKVCGPTQVLVQHCCIWESETDLHCFLCPSELSLVHTKAHSSAMTEEHLWTEAGYFASI